MSAEAVNYRDDYLADDAAVISDALWSGLPLADVMNLPGVKGSAKVVTVHDVETLQLGQECRTLDPVEAAMTSLLGRMRQLERRIGRQRYIGFVTTETVVELVGMSDEGNALDRRTVLDTFDNLVIKKLVADGEQLVAARPGDAGSRMGYRFKNSVVFEDVPGRDSNGDSSEHVNRLVRQAAGRTALWLAIAPPTAEAADDEEAAEADRSKTDTKRRRSDWMDRAICRDEDPELFFPVGKSGPALQQIAEAKAVCRRCPVMAECREWALETGQDAGVWGGISEDERRALKRRNGRTRARTV